MPVPTAPTPLHGREINKGLLADAVYDRLLGDIIGGRYRSEERLNVDRIAEEFGVSRTPVREALILLSASGFVEVVRNSRTQVSAWTVCDIRDRLEVVGSLVCLTVADRRFDLGGLGEPLSPASLESGVAGDAHRFLDVVEAMVRDGANNVAAYVLRELVSPLRLFLADAVLFEHDIDLLSRRDERAALLADAVDVSRTGNRLETERLFAAYVVALAAGLAPRVGDAVLSFGHASASALRASR
ncbi:GntR family transcriptional regulator [Plantibacter sp. YIM 135249]|uniref:GntR family transcriptional regulator n=1 Tax=Plantibacter sp. YIM 135249 TaxID=3423918 RepID=UPI003D32CAF7